MWKSSSALQGILTVDDYDLQARARTVWTLYDGIESILIHYLHLGIELATGRATCCTQRMHRLTAAGCTLQKYTTRDRERQRAREILKKFNAAHAAASSTPPTTYDGHAYVRTPHPPPASLHARETPTRRCE